MTGYRLTVCRPIATGTSDFGVNVAVEVGTDMVRYLGSCILVGVSRRRRSCDEERTDGGDVMEWTRRADLDEMKVRNARSAAREG